MSDDKLIASYLRRLRRAARRLPRQARRELTEEISEHLAQASGPVPETLARLGEPEQIAAAALGDLPQGRGGRAQARRGGRLGGRDLIAVLLLLLGGIAGLIVAGPLGAVLGWVAGVVLLCSSPRWGWLDKTLGSLIWPGGLALPFALATMAAGSETCSSAGGCTTSGLVLGPGLGIALAVLGIIGPVAVAIRLTLSAAR